MSLLSKRKDRLEMLDLLRGAAMVLVVFYHIVYDLKFIYGKNIPAAVTPGEMGFEILHTCFLWVLFCVSGICSGFSRDPVRRGAALYTAGFLITLATALFMPSELIVFGVLSCFGGCMAITGLLKKYLEKIPWAVRFAVFFALWVIFRDFHRTGCADFIVYKLYLPFPQLDCLYPIGVTGPHFHSADYFPLIPFIFMFLTGNALYVPVSEHKLPEGFYRVKSGVLGAVGRNSLLIYAVHQPVLLLIFELIF